MNFIEALTEAFSIQFELYNIRADDADLNDWHLMPGYVPLTGAGGVAGAKAAATDYIRTSAGRVPLGVWADLGDPTEAGYNIVAAVPAQ